MLKAYHELGYFYYSPVNKIENKVISKAEFSVMHLLSIEKEIEEQLNKIPEDKKTHWMYEEFCANPKMLTENLLQNTLKMDNNAIFTFCKSVCTLEN